MDLWLRVVLGIFATYRLAQLIAIDEGPLKIFFRFREWTTLIAMQHQKAWLHSFHDLVNCPYCVGVWMAALVAVLILINQPVSNAVLIFMGIAGGQCFLQQLVS